MDHSCARGVHDFLTEHSINPQTLDSSQGTHPSEGHGTYMSDSETHSSSELEQYYGPIQTEFMDAVNDVDSPGSMDMPNQQHMYLSTQAMTKELRSRGVGCSVTHSPGLELQQQPHHHHQIPMRQMPYDDTSYDPTTTTMVSSPLPPPRMITMMDYNMLKHKLMNVTMMIDKKKKKKRWYDYHRQHYNNSNSSVVCATESDHSSPSPPLPQPPSLSTSTITRPGIKYTFTRTRIVRSHGISVDPWY